MMNFNSLKRDDIDEKRLPDSIYKSVVRSIYADSNSLAIGIFCCVVAPIILFWKTGDPAQIIFSALFFLVGSIRLILARSFENATQSDPDVSEFSQWEGKYTYISASYMLVLGFWYFVSVARSDDPYVQLLSLSLILCYLIGIIGRNFASNKVVQSQVAISAILLVSGSAFFGDLYGILLALFLFPFLVAIHFMATRLRAMLFRAEINALNSRTIANRFDVALENVAHGIAMFDNTGTVVVANDRFMQLAGLADWEIIGCDMSILDAAEIEDSEEPTLASQINACILQNRSSQFTFTLKSGKVIEADYNSMSDGGVIVLSDISERRASEQVIRDLANFDPLTNLPNRRYFMQEVQALLGDGRIPVPCSMFFIDLDKFKEVNDTLGHAIGDKLLRTVSTRLRLLVDEKSMLCRFGGDEFVVLVSGLKSHGECAEFAEIICAELQAPALVEGHRIDVGASIGIAICPNHGTNADTLLQHADAALYDAKAKGRSTYTFYTDDLGENIRIKRELESDLKDALKHGHIEVHYQPLIDIKKGRITTCEALARWEHPEHGRISPGVFVELAEECGLILDLGEYILRKAMMECLHWPEDVRVAVNVSSIQFHKSNVYSLVSRLLKETGLAANKLDIEVTESAMIGNVEEISTTLKQLSALGVNISLDDFGTGFSSLSYLHKLPFDKVKIDRSFVVNSIASDRSLTLLRGVVDLIKRLGLRVVLEGIENEDQLQMMSRQIDVNEVQGFLFFKPMTATDIRTIIVKEAIFKEKAQKSA